MILAYGNIASSPLTATTFWEAYRPKMNPEWRKQSRIVKAFFNGTEFQEAIGYTSYLWWSARPYQTEDAELLCTFLVDLLCFMDEEHMAPSVLISGEYRPMDLRADVLLDTGIREFDKYKWEVTPGGYGI